MLDSYIYLQNPAWVFRGNVVSHMGSVPKSTLMVHFITFSGFRTRMLAFAVIDDSYLP
jgi:hypothetical protein